MVTMSMADCSLKPEFQYCAFCKYYNVSVPSISSPNRGFGVGVCTASPTQITYLFKSSCKQFKFAFRPVYDFSEDEFEWYKYKMHKRLEKYEASKPKINDYRKNK